MLKTITISAFTSFILCLSGRAQTVISDLEVTDSLRIFPSVVLNGGAEIQTTATGTGIPYPEFKIVFDPNAKFILGNGNLANGNSGVFSVFGSGNALNSTWESFVVGSWNTLDDTELSAVIGYGNSLNSQGKRTYVFGNNNIFKARDSMVLGAYNIINSAANEVNYGAYVFGQNLHLNPASSVSGILLLGFNNSENLNFSNTDLGARPFFIIGNGYGTAPSNALVIQRNGRATVTHKSYIAPTTLNPVPSQPETWVVEGATTLKGQVDVNGIVHVKPGGDLDMGSFTSTPGTP